MSQQRNRSFIRRLRTGLWHLRKGGLTQMRTWRQRSAMHQDDSAEATLAQTQGTNLLRFAAAHPPTHAPNRPDITAAVILDDFSAMAWRYEFNTVPVTPGEWRTQLASQRIDLLFVESAWHGNADAWQYHLAGTSAPRPALVEFVRHCRDAGIPTVFWNKEDPPHFNDFLETARLFDVVFTTDVTLVDAYRDKLGHDRIGVLPFAAQDAVHNPIRPRTGFHERDVAFAGMYFTHKFPERREQMDILLRGALDVSPRMDHGLEIFSRFLDGDERYQFPDELADHVVGSLPYDQMLTAYKAYKVFLNVNSVVDSPSMCARRIFEIVASGTPVVSTRSAAVPTYFRDDQVPIVDTREDAANVVRALVRSGELRDRTTQLAQREIWSKHTYAHRAQTVLDAIGVDAQPRALPPVTAITSTNRPGQLDHILGSIARQDGVAVQLSLVTHGFDPDQNLKARALELGIDIVTQSAPADWSLGACLRAAIDRADGEVVSKMDDDDLYGPRYLLDLLYAMRFSRADVVGKQGHYMYLPAHDATLLRFPWREHHWTDMVMGPTLTAHRDVFDVVAFGDLTRGEDSDWLRRATKAGLQIYSSDRFNFVQMRSGGHTWQMDDRAALATGDVAFFGHPAAHAFV